MNVFEAPKNWKRYMELEKLEDMESESQCRTVHPETQKSYRRPSYASFQEVRSTCMVLTVPSACYVGNGPKV